MNLLVTGSSGLLGTRLCQIAADRKYRICAVYNTHEPRYGTACKLDVTHPEAMERLFEKVKPEAVVHAAALSDVDKCEKEKELAWKINVEATATTARLCRRFDAFLVYVSTDYVFNGEEGTYKETDSPDPINYYGITKLKGEEAVKESVVNYCIARTSVVYGAIPTAGKVNFALWLLEKLGRHEEVRIVTDQWNSPTLNTNLAEMILEILETKIEGTFHLAGATRVCRYDFAKLIAQAFNIDLKYIRPATSNQIPWTARRPHDSSLNVEKATQTLKNKPIQIHEALQTLRKEVL